MNDDPNVDLDRRIAASRPAQPYPRSVRYHGAWVDGRQRVRPAVVALHAPNARDDELARIRRDDRRALVLVLLFGAVIFATLVVGVLRAP